MDLLDIARRVINDKARVTFRPRKNGEIHIEVVDIRPSDLEPFQDMARGFATFHPDDGLAAATGALHQALDNMNEART